MIVSSRRYRFTRTSLSGAMSFHLMTSLSASRYGNRAWSTSRSLSRLRCISRSGFLPRFA